MPCRLQPYIWISDDVLARAYLRFARACQHSHSHPPTHPRKPTRRHGSSVPGPLEARRRLARRRMAALSAATPPSFVPDFGSLFGTGAIDVGALWSPPATVHAARPPPPPNAPLTPHPASSLRASASAAAAADRGPSHLSPVGSPRTLDGYLDLLGSCTHVQSVRHTHAALHSDGDLPVGFSKAAFACLLHSAAPDQLVDFLQGELDHPDAHNTHAYLHHIFRTPLDTTALSDYVTLVCDKIALGTMSDSELVAIIHALLDAPKSGASLSDRDDALAHAANLLTSSIHHVYPSTPPPEAVVSGMLDLLFSLPPRSGVVHDMSRVYAWLPGTAQRSTRQSLTAYLSHHIRQQTRRHVKDPDRPLRLGRFLRALPPQYASDVVSAATLQFLTYMQDIQASDDIADTHVSAERLCCWLLHLRQHLPHLLTPLTPSAKAIYSEIASRYSPSDLSRHMVALPSLDAANVLFHYWIKPVTAGGSGPPRAVTRRPAQAASPSEAYGITYTFQRRPALRSTAAGLRETATLWKRKSGSFGDRDVLVQLFSHLSSQKVEYSHWLDQTFRVMANHEPPGTVFKFYRALVSAEVKIPYAVATNLIHYLVDAKKPAWAYAVFDRPGAAQWLSSMPELVFAMIENYPVRSEFLFRLLHRPEYTNSLPPALRTRPKNPLSAERVNLVQHMAYAMARSPHLTPTMAFRRVQDCLRYLVDRGAPVSSLMSRALVHSGLTRPLGEGRWLSRDKCAWIVAYVRRLEGDNVARMVDEAAWGLRNPKAEIRNAHMRKFARLDSEAQARAWEFRKGFGHASHRWKRVDRPFRAGS